MLNQLISLSTLLESHELPFVIIDSSLTIVGLNKAWEKNFSISKADLIGQPCCEDTENCRHSNLFKNLEPYEVSEIKFQNTSIKVKGVPLLDHDGKVYLGESATLVNPIIDTHITSKMAGSSPEFMCFKKKLIQAAQSSIPVLLMGETGTGKELAAEFIHYQSKNASKEYVIVDCTVLNDELFESELFGHEKGAFTGANVQKIGLFEMADNGTLFLDEIGELPLSLQPKLLRALETGQFRRVGGTRTLASNVRIICATHRNLSQMVKDGAFREDLFYRLSIFPIQIPPLRQRLQDIPDIVERLLLQFNEREGRRYSIDKNALIKLIKHQWPGNIRELKNCLLLASNLCQNQSITEQDIMYTQQHTYATDDTQKSNINPLLQMECEVINSLIQKHQGNRKLIADEMNISERTLYRKLKRFGLN